MSFKHRQPGRKADESARRWLWVLVPMFLGIFLLPRVFSEFRGPWRNSLTLLGRSADQVQVVTVDEQSWRPAGEAQAIPNDQMQLAGKSREGHPVYVRITDGGGGGPARERQLYLRLADGRYQPIQRARE